MAGVDPYRARLLAVALVLCLGGCDGGPGRSGLDGQAGSDGPSPAAEGGAPDAGREPDTASTSTPDTCSTCSTRITYGSTWIKPPNHPADHDDVEGRVTWDGSCKVDATGNAYATLSNGWKPIFKGRSCVIALDYSGGCSPAPGKCATRVSYGPTWVPAPSHPASHDDVGGVLTWDGICHASGGQSWALLSNGWKPHFSGSNACDLAFRHTQCGGLFENPVVSKDCPDPGVLEVGGTYYMACTPGYAFPIRSSKDLVHWKQQGTVFSAASHPAWGTSHFWAPELHQVGGKFVVYFSARHGATNTFAVGALITITAAPLSVSPKLQTATRGVPAARTQLQNVQGGTSRSRAAAPPSASARWCPTGSSRPPGPSMWERAPHRLTKCP